MPPGNAGRKAEEIDPTTLVLLDLSVKAISFGIVEDDRAKWREVVECQGRHFFPQMSIDHDDVEFADRIGRDEIHDRLDCSRDRIDGNVMQGHIAPDLGLKSCEPGGVAFDGEDRARFGRPPKSRLATAEF